MIKVSSRLFIIGLVLTCFIMLSGIPAIANDEGNIDASVTVISGSDDGGGGGGGGGGGSSGVTSLTEYTTDNGTFVIDATAESADGKVKLNIPKGTIARNRNGQRLNSISIKQSSTPLPLDDYKFVCLTYDIGPNGATFDPPIHLTFKYNDLQVPAGVAEESLVIVTLQDGKWIKLEGCIVDKIYNTITVPISHFTTFTVMAHTTVASFEITRMTVNPDEVYPNEIVTVSVTITNTGGLAGSYNVTLKINDLELQTKRVTLGGGKSEIISFKVTPNKAGEYTTDVNGLSSNFKVKEPVPEGKVAEVSVSPAPASFTISDLSITPVEVIRLEKVTIAALVSNTGGSGGSYTVILKIDDKEEARKRVILNAGKSERVYFSIAKDILGSHTIDINGHAGQFTVKSLSKPAEALIIQPSTNWWRFGGIIAGLVIIVGILIFFYRRPA